MFFNFGFSDPVDVLLEQYVGNVCVSQQKLSGPPEILQIQFLQLAKHMASQSQPMKLRMVRWENVWNQFDSEWKKLELSVEFKNWKDDEE